MSRPFWIRLLIAAAVPAVAFAPPPATAARQAASRGAAPAAVGSQVVADNLNDPAAFTLAPDGRIFYGELKTGEIRIFDPIADLDTLFFTVANLGTEGEQGLLGLALHPNYATSQPFLYAYATRRVNGHLRNQILRIRDAGGTGTGLKAIFSSPTTPGRYHDGGHIAFGPDGMLYAVVGESHVPANSQDLGTPAGKVIRMTDGGSVPPGNPFSGSLIWTYGLRNSFGFGFDPQTSKLWETENGPTCNDELNLIVAGRNYGWGPNETCSSPPNPPQNTNQDGPDPKLPKRFYTPPIAPTGLAFCQGCGITGAEGTFFYGNYNLAQIRMVTLTPDRSQIASVGTVFTNPGGGVLSMERGPDGTVYYSDGSAIYKLVQK